MGEVLSRHDARRARKAIAPLPSDCLYRYGPVTLKDHDDEGDGSIAFTGTANLAERDRGGDLIKASAFNPSLKRFLSLNPQLFFQHDWSFPIGRITGGNTPSSGLQVDGFVMPNEDTDGFRLMGAAGDRLEWVRTMVMGEFIRTLSVGIRNIQSKDVTFTDDLTGAKKRGRDITKVELLEVSFVTIPQNAGSTTDLMKMYEAEYGHDIALSLVGPFLKQEEESEEGNQETGDAKYELVSLDELEKRRYEVLDKYPE